jgi:outer membrane protein OmpA-like peptidoglycan-associated protein
MMVGRVCQVGLLAAIVLGGCATVRPTPHELLAAREALDRARVSPAANLAPAELVAAENDLRAAEEMQAREPGSAAARERAYVAWRRAERARIAGLYVADLDALADGRRSVERMRRNLEKRASDEQRMLRQREEEARVLEAERVERDRALETRVAEFATIQKDDRGPIVRLAGEVVFRPSSEQLTFEGKRQLDAMVRAFRACPRTKIMVWVAPTEGARGADASLLAQRRSQRLAAELVERGIPSDLVVVASAEPAAARPEAEAPSAASSARSARASPRAPIAVDIALVDHEPAATR